MVMMVVALMLSEEKVPGDGGYKDREAPGQVAICQALDPHVATLMGASQ